jgi:DNA-binding transcriptional MerR regulator
MEQKTYTISDLAKEYDVTPRTIRLYEELGIVAPARDGNRRIYSERDRVRLRLALRGKRLGLSLAEAKELIDLYDSNPDEKVQIQRLLERLQQRIDQLEQQRRDIDAALAEIGGVCHQARTTLAELERRRH